MAGEADVAADPPRDHLLLLRAQSHIPSRHRASTRGAHNDTAAQRGGFHTRFLWAATHATHFWAMCGGRVTPGHHSTDHGRGRRPRRPLVPVLRPGLPRQRARPPAADRPREQVRDVLAVAARPRPAPPATPVAAERQRAVQVPRARQLRRRACGGRPSKRDQAPSSWVETAAAGGLRTDGAAAAAALAVGRHRAHQARGDACARAGPRAERPRPLREREDLRLLRPESRRGAPCHTCTRPPCTTRRHTRTVPHRRAAWRCCAAHVAAS